MLQGQFNHDGTALLFANWFSTYSSISTNWQIQDL